jgi:hypothetical protein
VDVVTPLDLQRTYRPTGHIFHSDAARQLFVARPLLMTAAC